MKQDPRTTKYVAPLRVPSANRVNGKIWQPDTDPDPVPVDPDPDECSRTIYPDPDKFIRDIASRKMGYRGIQLCTPGMTYHGLK